MTDRTYDLTYVMDKFDAGETLKYVFFWGHTPSGNEVDKSCFSQWYPSPFEVEGVIYKTTEHWMMAKKAELFDDKEMLVQIIDAEKPGKAKALGRQVKGFDAETWDEHKMQIVVDGNLHKFAQDEALTQFLKNTGERILVEASPLDTIWGIGMAQSDENINNPHCWKGENLLGFALMEVRDLIRI